MQFAIFVSSTFLSTKGKKMALLVSTVCLLILCISLQFTEMSEFDRTFLKERSVTYALLFLLSVSICMGIEFWYIKTNEYQFLRSLPTLRWFHLFAIILQIVYIILMFTGISLFFSFGRGISPFVSLLYSPIVLISSSTFMMHIIYILLSKARKNRYIAIFLQCASLFACIGITLYFYNIDVRVYDFESFFIIKGINIFLSPNIFSLIICLVWLLILFLLDQPYESFLLNSSVKSGSKVRTIFKGVYQNQLFKDSFVARTKPTYLIISFFYAAVGVYCAKYRFEASVCIVIAIIFSIILSTISEELIVNDIQCMPLIRHFPISLKKLFWSKIASVCTLISLPSIIFLIIVSGFSTFTFLSFLLALTVSICVSSLLSTMQCMITLNCALMAKNAQFMLLSSIFISLVFPVFPILYICLYGRKAQINFCGGRE